MEGKVHGALVEVLDVGVLLLGDSGIGKSECALELVTRGHRLVADDAVELRRDGQGRVLGRAPHLIGHHMEIRGIGIVSIPELYGPESVSDEGAVDLVCHLERWREGGEYERVGLDLVTETIAGAELPSLRLPNRGAASMATLIELAAREHRRRRSGAHAARRLDQRLRNASRPS